MAANGDVSSVPRSESPTGSPRSASISLHAAAALNAGLQREPSRSKSESADLLPAKKLVHRLRFFSLASTTCSHHSNSPLGSSNSSLARSLASPPSRRRSTILMNLQLNDPTVPAPGEMFQDHMRASPQPYSGGIPPESSRHIRTPSLGELHQELEAEQEGHVVSNKLHFHRLLLVDGGKLMDLEFAEPPFEHDSRTAARASASSSKPPACIWRRREYNCECCWLREAASVAPCPHFNTVTNRKPCSVSFWLLLFSIANLSSPSELYGDGPRRHAAPVQDAKPNRFTSTEGDFHQC